MATSRIPLNEPIRTLEPVMDAVADGVSRIISSGIWLHGSEVAGFEDAFARLCGMPHCLAVANGTDGLELALRAAGAADAEVVTVANAGGYTTTACRIVGAIPVYVDVEPERLVMDTGVAIGAVTDRTRAVVVTHLYGNTVDVASIREGLVKAGRSDVTIIEDASQAHGGWVGRSRVGAVGDLSVFSFYPTKNLGAVGDAGAILSHSKALHDRLLALHQYGWTSRYNSEVPGGRNSRMSEIQASVLRMKLPYLDQWNEERRAILREYERAVDGSGIRLVTNPAGAAHLGVLALSDREALRRHLDASHIDSTVHFPILDPDQASQKGLPMRRHGLEVSERSVGEILSVPVYPGMPQDYVSRVSDALRSFSVLLEDRG